MLGGGYSALGKKSGLRQNSRGGGGVVMGGRGSSGVNSVKINIHLNI